MPFAHVDLREGAVAPVVAHEERGHTRGVGLEGEHEHVGEQPHILAVRLRRPVGQFTIGNVGESEPLEPHQPLLDLADAVQIFVEFAPVGAAESACKPSGIVGHEVKD